MVRLFNCSLLGVVVFGGSVDAFKEFGIEGLISLPNDFLSICYCICMFFGASVLCMLHRDGLVKGSGLFLPQARWHIVLQPTFAILLLSWRVVRLLFVSVSFYPA